MKLAAAAPRARSFALTVVLAALLTSACGSSSSQQVKPAAYVKSMCTALGNWKDTIQSAGAALQSSGAANASRPVAKADYQKFVSSLVTATGQAADDLRAAGTPAVSGGQQLASHLAQAFDTATQRLVKAENQAKAISTDSASSFQLGASSVTTQIKSALQAIAAVAPGRSAQLRQAAAKQPACQVLG
ncbi:MAG: hypothetical protein JO244_00720 [Solirubrobacterales bacterium]|nr:hypothetical protein [Solirubrobacterales bacterium]